MTTKEIEQLLKEIEEAHEKFMRGEISANDYCDIREKNYRKILNK